jgi:hypothetical protein
LEEKTMKKRSLFAAVAMLIVSAILLTSATYAWFATGGPATISTITGKVAEAGAGITLRTQPTSGTGATGWVTTLDYAMLAKDQTNNHFATNYTNTGKKADVGGVTWTFVNPTDDDAHVVTDSTNKELTYEPVSTANPRAHTQADPTIFAYQLSNREFSAANGDLASFYDEYSFYVSTISEDTDTETHDTNVNMALTIGGRAAPAARVAVYSYDGSTWTDHGIFSGSTETGWKPLVGALDLENSTYTDQNNNYVLDTSDSSTDANMAEKISGTAVTTTSAATAQTILLPDCHVQDSASGNRLVKVFVWVEGQDADCKPTDTRVPGGDVTVQFSFTMA